MANETLQRSLGTIFVSSRAGSSMLRTGRLMSSDEWLDCWGPFGSGDAVYVVVRGRDGGQKVLCRAHACCSADEMRHGRWSGTAPYRVATVAGGD